MKNYKPYLLTAGLVVTTAFFSLLGEHWNHTYYQQTDTYQNPYNGSEKSIENLPFVHAMAGLHDGLIETELTASAVEVMAATPHTGQAPPAVGQMQTIYEKLLLSSFSHQEGLITELPLSSKALVELTYELFANPTMLASMMPQTQDSSQAPSAENTQALDAALDATDRAVPASLEAPPTEDTALLTTAPLEAPAEPELYEFTTVSDDYFEDAVFIGDSRTVGICEYSGITNATFLCKTSLTIYDYEKPYITFQDRKMSVKDALSQQQFAKIYIMLGINECGYGTTEKYLEAYQKVIEDIRALQPEALIFIQGNLLITTQKSQSGSITNERLTDRNAAIATLANQHDTFYIDINESSLCQDGALIAEYTWDHVHIKAQYYATWKQFLLEHAIVTEAPPSEPSQIAEATIK